MHNDASNSSRPDPDFPDLGNLTFVEREYAQPILLTLAAARRKLSADGRQAVLDYVTDLVAAEWAKLHDLTEAA